MTKIKPFRAIIYNQEKIKDLSEVVCPPYDIISPAMQEHYYKRNPYNLINILLSKDTSKEDKYHHAANIFKDWLKDEILIREGSPAIYFYSQQYKIKGEKKTRVGFIALLHLGKETSAAFGHEHTHIEPKEDRLRLLRQVKANLSPIFVVFSDKKRIIQRSYQQHIQDEKPFIDIVDDEKISHKLWRIDSPEIINKIQDEMKNTEVFIADGHHRYEVASIYRDEMKKKLESITGEEDFNYLPAYFTEAESRDLTILPIHRIVKTDPALVFDGLRLSLNNYFKIDQIKDRADFFFLIEKAGHSEHVIGMYKDKKYWLLRLKNVGILEKMITDKPKEYSSLDVSILNYILFKNTLGMDFNDKQNITFGHDINELIELVDNNSGYIAFFLNPVSMKQIMAVALKGEKMPPKTTFFYPKVLSGLVINKLE